MSGESLSMDKGHCSDCYLNHCHNTYDALASYTKLSFELKSRILVVSISHNCVIFIPFGKFFHLLAQDIIGEIYVRCIVRYLGISLTKKAQIVIGLILIRKLVHGYPTKYPFHTIYPQRAV
jgi:hypothetical protein